MSSVKVVVRSRPFNSRERKRKSKSIISMVGNQTVIQDPSRTGDERKFTYDYSFWSSGNPALVQFDSRLPAVNAPDSTQVDVFQHCGADVISHASEGYNVSVFAYGQTGSGKSYTMMGSEVVPTLPQEKAAAAPAAESAAAGAGGDTAGAGSASDATDGKGPNPEAGLIPRISNALFEFVRENEVSTADVEAAASAAVEEGGVIKLFKVEVSYVEIYMEAVKDLLGGPEGAKKSLRVREDPEKGPFVDGLTRMTVSSSDEIFAAIEDGNTLRTVAATAMNAVSSRSHAIFTVVFTQTTVDPSAKRATDKVSKINLVDLAGSERADSTGATGQRLKEASMINKSLSTLGRVIAALAKNSGNPAKMDLVPYRDSALTFLLKESLGGNAKTTMIATISPADINYEETLSTLRYADQAKRIVNAAVVNEDPTTRLIRELREEIATLREELSTLKANPSRRPGKPGSSSQPPTAAGGRGRGAKSASGRGGSKSSGERQAQVESRLARAASIAEMLTSISEDPAAGDESAPEESPKSGPTVTPVRPGAAFVGLRRALMDRQKEERVRARRASVARSSSQRSMLGGAVTRRKLAGVDVPHLTNLNEDPLLSECLVFPLHAGYTYTGSEKSSCQSKRFELEGSNDGNLQFMELHGQGILPCHCYFRNLENTITVAAMPDARVFVNGKALEPSSGPLTLNDNDRVLVGRGTFMRFHALHDVPEPPRSPLSPSASSPGSEPSPVFDWSFAFEEVRVVMAAEEEVKKAAVEEELARTKTAAEAEAAQRLAVVQDELQQARTEAQKEREQAELRAKAAETEAVRAKELLEEERKRLRAEFEAAEKRAKDLEDAAALERESLLSAASKAEADRQRAEEEAKAGVQAATAEAEKAKASSAEIEAELLKLRLAAERAEEERKKALAESARQQLLLEQAAERAEEARRKATADAEAQVLAARLAAERAEAARKEAEAAAAKERLELHMQTERAEEAKREAEAIAAAEKLAREHAEQRAEEQKLSLAAASESERAALQEEAKLAEAARAKAEEIAKQEAAAVAAAAAEAEKTRLKLEADAVARTKSLEEETKRAEAARAKAEAESAQQIQALMEEAKLHEAERLNAAREMEAQRQELLRAAARAEEERKKLEAEMEAQVSALTTRTHAAEEGRRAVEEELKALRKQVTAATARAERAESEIGLKLESIQTLEAQLTAVKQSAASATPSAAAEGSPSPSGAGDGTSSTPAEGSRSEAGADGDAPVRAQETPDIRDVVPAQSAGSASNSSTEPTTATFDSNAAGPSPGRDAGSPHSDAPTSSSQVVVVVVNDGSGGQEPSGAETSPPSAAAPSPPAPSSPAPEPASDTEPPKPPLRGLATMLRGETGSYEGYLRKQGGSHAAWKRRWIFLSPPLLFYSKDCGQDWRGQIDLTNSHVFVRPKRFDPEPFVFNVVSPERTYYFQANNASEMQAWIQAIGTVATFVEEPDEKLLAVPRSRKNCVIS